MKFIITLIFALSASSAYAKLYKCQVNGITSYQEQPCTSKGSEFELRQDISVEQHNAAVSKLNQEIAVSDEKKRIAKEQADKERLIRAQEEQADADFENARQSERQADALDALKKNRNKRFYQYPYINKPDYITSPHATQAEPSHQKQIKLPGKNVSKSSNKKLTIKKKSMLKK